MEALRTAILVAGMVVVMMLMIESMNVESGGRIFSRLKNSRFGQILVSALLGSVPGCMGGFASVSLYTHGMLSFGALVAMMIATSGDEAFVMFGLCPGAALKISLALLVVAVVAGVAVDWFDLRFGIKPVKAGTCDEMHIHEEDLHAKENHRHGRHFGWKRIVMIAGVMLYVAALVLGFLEHGEEEQEAASSFNLLNEEWMYYMFAAFSVILLAVLCIGSDHFIEEHLWEHIIERHLPKMFAWTFGVLLLLGFCSTWFDLESWISSNIALMILLATAIGIIPESGPHMVFVTLFAAGVVPVPVLVASCISQDGHAALPLLAESKGAFLRAKAINCVVALIVGFSCMWLGL